MRPRPKRCTARPTAWSPTTSPRCRRAPERMAVVNLVRSERRPDRPRRPRGTDRPRSRAHWAGGAIGCRARPSSAGSRSWTCSRRPSTRPGRGQRGHRAASAARPASASPAWSSEFCAAGPPRTARCVATGVCVPVDGGGLPYGPVVGHPADDVARQLGEPRPRELLGPLAAGPDEHRRRPRGATSGRTERYAALRPLADELAKTRLFESILAGLARAGRAVARRCWCSKTCSGPTRPAPTCSSFLTRNLADAAGAARRHLPQRRARPRPPAAAVAAASSRRHARVTSCPARGPRPRRDGRADRRHPRATQPDWTLVEAVWARSQGNAVLRRGAHRGPPQPDAVSRAAGRDHEPGRRAVRRRAARCCGWPRPWPAPTVDHRLPGGGRPTLGGRCSSTAALAEAVDRQVLVVEPDRAGYRFRHALLREAVERRCCPASARRLHRRLAVALTADPSLAPAPGRPSRGRAGRPLVGGRRVGRGADRVAGGRRRGRAGRGPSPRRSPTWSGPWRPSTAWAADADGLADRRSPGRCWSRPPTSPTSPGPTQRSVELARAAIELVDAEHRSDAALARCYTPARPQRLGRRGLRRRVRRLSPGRGAACPPIRPRWSWPGSWPRRHAGSCSCRASREADATVPRGHRGGPRRGRPGRGGPRPLHARVLPGRARPRRRRHRPGARGAGHRRGAAAARTI